MAIITNSSIVVEATEKEFRGKRFIAFNLYRSGVGKGNYVHEVEYEGDIFIKIIDAVHSIGAVGAEIITNSEEVLGAFFNVYDFNVVFNRDEDLYKSLNRYFEEDSELIGIIEELYFTEQPLEESESKRSLLFRVTEYMRKFIKNIIRRGDREI